MLSINPCPPCQGKGKGGKGREAYEFENYNNFTNNADYKRNNVKYTKQILGLLYDHGIACYGDWCCASSWPWMKRARPS